MFPALPRLGLALAALAFSLAASAQSRPSSPVPVARSEASVAFIAEPGTVSARIVALPAIDQREVASAKSANASAMTKRLQVGVGRGVYDFNASSAALEWREVGVGQVARWEVGSPGAESLRIELRANALPPGFELRFAGSGAPSTVYGPFTADDFVAGDRTFWSPVLEGDVGTVEVFVPRGVAPEHASLGISAVSHLFVKPTDSDLRAKAGSGSCNLDLVCESAGNAALANIGKSVAMMIFTDGGSTYQCTGTLIQSTDGSSTPYFYSANHCLSTQAVATTLTTHWFYDRTTCNVGGTDNPAYVQKTGGATLLYAQTSSDVLLLRLNTAPPAGAWFAGWDAAAIAAGAAITGVHHPHGDWTKVSRGTVTAFEIPQSPYSSMIRTQWTSGVTEGGSSGSGLFTIVGPPATPTDYRLRGGLWGGASACGLPQSSLYDFYSRLDLAYASISQWIDPPPPPNNTLVVTKAGTGTGGVTSSPAGINCGTTCSASFTPGASVTLTASPTGGSVFGGWGGACSGSGSCSVTMDTGKSVSATFLPPGSGVTLTVGKAGTGGGTVTSSQGGLNCGPTCSVSLDGGLVVSLYPAAAAGSSFTGWSGDCTGVAPCTVTMDRSRSVTASFSTGGTPFMISASTSAIAFGGQSMGTTSPQSPVVVMNVGPNTVTFGAVSASAQFGQSGNCTNIAPGFSCTVNATFTPAVTGIALGQAAPVTGQLSIPSNATGAPHVITLTGTAERSLVTHFYRSILRRAPDAGGKAFWESEAQRLVGIGVNVNEAWYAMAMAFYGSAEYAAFNRGSAGYVTDLYTTFFNRTPDGAGLSFWNNEIATGLPRGVALAGFMFSTEFRNFSQGIFGGATVRPEVDAVVDFYRGLLGRPPDSGGFAFWLQRFRAAQCAGQAQVLAEVESISSAFGNGAEYTGRARSNLDFVGDLYNAFLRRGGDLAGVQFWINQVAIGAQTRDQVRVQFKNSVEFQARVSAILAGTCIP
jgi:hypothetical protein